MEIEMKLLAIVVLGILFAATLARADETASKMLHKRLNTCDADAKQTGVPMQVHATHLVQLRLSDRIFGQFQQRLGPVMPFWFLF
jgi:hypothetical protein